MTAHALTFYAIGLVGHATVEIADRVFYALHDTSTPVRVALGTVSANIVLSIILMQTPLSYSGSALANSLAALTEGGGTRLAALRASARRGGGSRLPPTWPVRGGLSRRGDPHGRHQLSRIARAGRRARRRTPSFATPCSSEAWARWARWCTSPSPPRSAPKSCPHSFVCSGLADAPPDQAWSRRHSHGPYLRRILSVLIAGGRRRVR